MSGTFKDFSLKSIELESTRPNDAKEAVGTYLAVFELRWGTTAVELKIYVSTSNGWENARFLAYDQVKDLAQWLSVSVDRLKEGALYHG